MPSVLVRRGPHLAATCLAILLVVARGGAEPSHTITRHVLYLNSYHSGYAWADALVAGMRSVLQRWPEPIELWVEHMDTRRLDGAEQLASFTDLLRVRHRHRTFDAIVAADDAALRFLLTEHDHLFPGVPVVFMGINSDELAARASPQTYTGMREILRTDDILDLMLALRPDTRHIVVVTDATANAAVQRVEYRDLAARRPSLSFSFLDGAQLSFEQLLEDLRRASTADAVLASAFTRDATDRYHNLNDAMARIADASSAPVYSLTVSELGQGLLAGADNGGRQHSTRAAEMLLRVFDGAPTADIPREAEGAPRFIIDYQQAMRWRIPEERLPATALIVNKPTSRSVEQRRLFQAAVGLALLQAVVIGWLIANVLRRRRAERTLMLQTRALEASNADLALVNASLRTEMDERRVADEHLRQARRMDSIGPLAGSIAHDFNNQLTVIASYADLAECSVGRVAPGAPTRAGHSSGKRPRGRPHPAAAGVQPYAGAAAAGRRSQHGRQRPTSRCCVG